MLIGKKIPSKAGYLNRRINNKGVIDYSISFQERPSRVIIATDATGPQVPA